MPLSNLTSQDNLESDVLILVPTESRSCHLLLGMDASITDMPIAVAHGHQCIVSWSAKRLLMGPNVEVFSPIIWLHAMICFGPINRYPLFSYAQRRDINRPTELPWIFLISKRIPEPILSPREYRDFSSLYAQRQCRSSSASSSFYLFCPFPLSVRPPTTACPRLSNSLSKPR